MFNILKSLLFNRAECKSDAESDGGAPCDFSPSSEPEKPQGIYYKIFKSEYYGLCGGRWLYGKAICGELFGDKYDIGLPEGFKIVKREMRHRKQGGTTCSSIKVYLIPDNAHAVSAEGVKSRSVELFDCLSNL